MAKRASTGCEIDYDLLDRQRLSLAQGALTNSKRPACFVDGVYPNAIDWGRGCEVWDTKGKRYIDFICALGTSILGYGNTELIDTIFRQAQRGVLFSLGTEMEVQTAETVKALFPFVGRVKFLKSGSEACTAAIRIARANRPERTLIYSDGYHGWHDEFVSLAPPHHGIMGQPNIAKLPAAVSDIDTKACAVIIEPVLTDASDARISYLRELRDYCTRHGILLIFDEIITAFRFPKISVSTTYGVEPDLICLGKAIANGMPLSVVGGSEKLMNGTEYFVSSTYAGEAISLACADRTMKLLKTKYSLPYLWDKGAEFIRRFNALMPGKLWLEAYPTRGVFRGDEMTKALFWQESAKAGILFGASWFWNFAHIPLMDEVLSTSQDIATRIATGSVRLEGALPASPFAARLREKKETAV